MAEPQCTVMMTIHDPQGNPASGCEVTLVKALKDETWHAYGPLRIRANQCGVVTFSAPRDSFVYIRANVVGLESPCYIEGVPFYVPDVDSVALIWSATDPPIVDFPNTVPVAVSGGVGADYLPLVGGTMLGPIVLPADPATALQAATKAYVDAHVGGASESYVDAADALRVLRAGDTMTGPLVLPGNPTTALQAATKQYVDANIVSGGGVTKLYVDDADAADRYYADWSGKVLRVSAYPSLATALIEIGASPRILLIDQNTTVDFAANVPRTLRFAVAPDCFLVKGATGSISFQGQGIVPTGLQHIFWGFAPGEVAWLKEYPPEIYPQWWGAVGDTYTDCWPAFQSAVYAQARPNAVGGGYGGGTIVVTVPEWHYYRMSQRWMIDRTVHIRGTAGLGQHHICQIRFDPNAPGVYVSEGAIGTVIEFLSIHGQAAAPTNTATGSGMTLTRTSGPPWGVVNHGSYRAIKLNGQEITSSSYDDNVINLGDWHRYVAEQNGRWCRGDNSQMVPDALNGATLYINGVYYVVTSNDHFYFSTTPPPPPGAAGWAYLAAIGPGPHQVVPMSYHGLDIKARVKLSCVSIFYVQGDAFRFVSVESVLGGQFLYSNCDMSEVDSVTSYGASGWGMIISGTDANVIKFGQMDFRNNKMGGLRNAAQHGNSFDTIHCAYNEQWDIFFEGSISNGTVRQYYKEGNPVPDHMGGKYLFMGGEGIESVAAHGGSYIQSGTNGWATGQYMSVRTEGLGTAAQPGIRTQIGSDYGGSNHISFGALNDPYTVSSGGNLAFAIQYNTPYLGWYNLNYGSIYGETALAISGGNVPEGRAQLRFPRGFWIGYEFARVDGGTSSPNGNVGAEPGTLYIQKTPNGAQLWSKSGAWDTSDWHSISQGTVVGKQITSGVLTNLFDQTCNYGDYDSCFIDLSVRVWTGDQGQAWGGSYRLDQIVNGLGAVSSQLIPISEGPALSPVGTLTVVASIVNGTLKTTFQILATTSHSLTLGYMTVFASLRPIRGIFSVKYAA